MTTPPPRLVGWARSPRGRWKQLATGDDSRLVLEGLRLATASWRQADLCVLPAGRHPTDGRE
jgi:hypothetical protein